MINLDVAAKRLFRESKPVCFRSRSVRQSPWQFRPDSS